MPVIEKRAYNFWSYFTVEEREKVYTAFLEFQYRDVITSYACVAQHVPLEWGEQRPEDSFPSNGINGEEYILCCPIGVAQRVSDSAAGGMPGDGDVLEWLIRKGRLGEAEGNVELVRLRQDICEFIDTWDTFVCVLPDAVRLSWLRKAMNLS